MVSRLLHRVACLALLGVLSGAPAVAVICAELCAPGAHHEQTEYADSSCHGLTASGPVIGEHAPRDCGDHGAASIGAVASLVSSRGDAPAMHPADAADAHIVAVFPSPGEGQTSLRGRAAPPLPARSSRVLRI